MTARPSIVSAGYMPLDVVHASGGIVDRRAGGTAANVAAILAFLGWDALLAGQVGDDLAGDELIADLRRAGVDTEQIRRSADALTPRLVHDVRPDGHFFGYRCPDCDSRFPRSRPLTLAAAADCAQAHASPTVFFFDRVNRGTLWLAEEYARQGAVVVFEPSVPANVEFLARAAAVAHVIKHSDDRSVGGLDELRVKPRSAQVRIVTHGEDGLEVRVGSRRGRRFPALATLTVDAGGAGDWTTAGFLARGVGKRGLDLDRMDEALRFGQALAAVSCAAVGARGLMTLTRDSVLRRAHAVLREGGLTSEPRLPAPRVLPRPAGACPTCLMPPHSARRSGDSVSKSVAVR